MRSTKMSNKYLEKAAALFPSMGYQKELKDKSEKQRYTHAYQTAGASSFANAGRSVLASGMMGVGVAGGMVAAQAASKPLGQRIATHLKDKGLASGKYRMADGSHNLEHILHDGIKVHSRVGKAALLTGAIAGAIPGASYADHFRHNRAKGVVEKSRNKDND